MSDSATLYRSTRYNPHEIEKKWQTWWEANALYKTDLHDTSKPPFYFLTMYPYPSGDLHVGHWYAETPADTAARFKRMRGYNVFFPMGFDAFGLPAENAAIKAAREGQDVHPMTLTYERMATMKKQFSQMGAMFDWDKTLATCDPDYYKWNQWFFLQMLKKGLAYRKLSPVDWCPHCNTTLAREQVIGDDRVCERCGTPVIKKELDQWYFKITAYAEELLSFEGLDWPQKVVDMQTNWIGRSEGAQVTFVSEQNDPIPVFTTRPDTLWGATFMVLSPEHPLVDKLTTPDQRAVVETYVEAASHKTEIDRTNETKEKTGVFTGAHATNPVNNARIPIWTADYVLMGYGTGAIMAVPAHDQRDFEFAKAFDLPIIPVVQVEGVTYGPELDQAYPGDGVLINSAPFNGLKVSKEGAQEGIRDIIAWFEEKGTGAGQINYRLHDWLISRQRYWGTPIPIIYCEDCGPVAEKEENLPVILPDDVAFMPTGESPLKSHDAFLHTTCPDCDKPATRETDTMDTFVDSSWYWFRYLTPQKADAPLDTSLADRWTPVNQYTGGIEHAILHLLYARFFTKVIRDLGFTKSDEPFQKLRNQGMILGEDHHKMSKSRGNVVNPDDLVAEYGADAVRTYLMFIGPWDQGGPWNTRGVEGTVRFLNRTWNVILDDAEHTDEPLTTEITQELRRATHEALKGVTQDLEQFHFNTAIAKLMTLVNVMTKHKTHHLAQSKPWQEACELLILMLAPFAPHIAEELWERWGQAHRGSVHIQSWPEYDASALVMNTLTMAVQVNGKVRAQIEVATDADKDTVLAVAKANENVLRHVQDKHIKREIVVPGKLVNIVVA